MRDSNPGLLHGGQLRYPTLEPYAPTTFSTICTVSSTYLMYYMSINTAQQYTEYISMSRTPVSSPIPTQYKDMNKKHLSGFRIAAA